MRNLVLLKAAGSIQNHETFRLPVNKTLRSDPARLSKFVPDVSLSGRTTSQGPGVHALK